MKKIVFSILVLLIFLCQLSHEEIISFFTNTPENVGLNILELVPKHGYIVDRHFVTTEDGYILEMHRISKPHANIDNKDNHDSKRRPPLLCVHGIASSAIDWINGGANKSVVYALVELGFDVWLANSRGTKFSRRHTILNPDVMPDRKQFWRFTFHELGVYDNPAMIDYILAETHHEQVIYFGISQGCTSFLVMCSERPEYNHKIALAQMLGPVAFWGNIFSPAFRWGLPSFERQLLQQDHIQLYEFLPRTVNEIFWPSVCAPTSPFLSICRFIMNFIVGFGSEQIEDDLVPIITGSVPSGGAMLQYLHFSQLVQSGRFQKFDWRTPDGNQRAYGQSTPPDYDLRRVVAKVAVHYGLNDWLLNAADAIKTTSMLPNVVVNNQIKYPKFTHANFMWGKDIFEILYNDVINITMRYADTEANHA